MLWVSQPSLKQTKYKLLLSYNKRIHDINSHTVESQSKNHLKKDYIQVSKYEILGFTNTQRPNKLVPHN